MIPLRSFWHPVASKGLHNIHWGCPASRDSLVSAKWSGAADLRSFSRNKFARGGKSNKRLFTAVKAAPQGRSRARETKSRDAFQSKPDKGQIRPDRDRREFRPSKEGSQRIEDVPAKQSNRGNRWQSDAADRRPASNRSHAALNSSQELPERNGAYDSSNRKSQSKHDDWREAGSQLHAKSQPKSQPFASSRQPVGDKFNGASTYNTSRQHQAAFEPRSQPPAPSRHQIGDRFNGAANDRLVSGSRATGREVSSEFQEGRSPTRVGQNEQWGRGSGGYASVSSTYDQMQRDQPVRGQGPIRVEPPAYYQPREGDPVLRGIRDSWRGDALYGVNPILAALAAQRREVHKLYCQEGSGAGKHVSQIKQIQKQAQALGIPSGSLSKHDMNVLTDNAAHQGVLLECAALNFESMDDFGQPPTATCPLWIALDEVTDPHNMGAIIRSAAVMGATGVLTCARNSSPLTPAVSKVSAGAIEHFPIFSCQAMQKTLAAARKSGWKVLGATISSSATPSHTLSLDRPTIIVLGNEGTGLRKNVEMACSDMIKIGASDALQPVGVDSLNVSVAAGILIHHFLTSRTGPV